MMLLALPLFAVLLLFCGSALGSVTASIAGTGTDARAVWGDCGSDGNCH